MCFFTRVGVGEFREQDGGLRNVCTCLQRPYQQMQDIGRGLLSYERRAGGCRLNIIWPVSPECNIRFYDVFAEDIFQDISHKVIEIRVAKMPEFLKNSGGIKSAIQSGKPVLAARVAVMKAKWFLRKKAEEIRDKFLRSGKIYYEYEPPKAIGWHGTEYQSYIRSVWNKLKADTEVNREEKYIHAYCGIIKDEEETIDYSSMLSPILFKKEYWNEVEDILGRKSGYVGVHIRRTDHKRAISNSCTDVFLKKMKAILDEAPETRFFLATDDRHEEERLKEVFGSRIVVQKGKTWGRDTAEGMKTGIIDCLCLSVCDYILGSYTSVFSWFSAAYFGKKLIICGENME